MFQLFFICLVAIAQGLFSTIISILCALACVYFFNQFDFKCKKVILTLIPVLCIMPSKIVALGVDYLIPHKGLIAIIWAHAALNIPLAFFIIYTATQMMNPQWRLIAQELGATQWQAYKDIQMPFLRSTLFSASILIFILCFTSFSIPMILGSAKMHMTPDVLLFHAYQAHDYWQSGIVYIMRLFVVLPLCFLSTKASHGWLEHSMMQERKSTYSFKKNSLWWSVVLIGSAAMVFLPFLSIVWQTFDICVIDFWFSIAKSDIDSVLKIPVYRVIINSLSLSLVSALGAVVIGYLLCKAMRNTHSVIVHGVISLLSIGVFLLGSVGCGVLFESMNRSFLFSRFLIAVLCHSILNYAFAYRVIDAHFKTWRSEWELLAQSFGAQSAQRWRTLELPFLRSSFIQAFCISFGLSLTEVVAGTILADNSGITIPIAIRMYREQGMQHCVIGMTIIVLLLMLLCSAFLNYKKNKI